MSVNPGEAGIDPRGPRVTAAVTAVVLLASLSLAVAGAPNAAAGVLAAQAIVFGIAATAGIHRHPYGVVFRRLVRPRVSAPARVEDPAGPTFAQLVGLMLAATGVLLHLVGVPLAVPVAAALAFTAAALNAIADLCLGCHLHVLLVRSGLLRRRTSAVDAAP